MNSLEFPQTVEAKEKETLRQKIKQRKQTKQMKFITNVGLNPGRSSGEKEIPKIHVRPGLKKIKSFVNLGPTTYNTKTSKDDPEIGRAHV